MGIPQYFAVAKSHFDLASDYSLILITLKAHALNQQKQPSLSNKHTNWNDFRRLINERLTLTISFKTQEDSEETVKFCNDTKQWAGCNATPQHTETIKAYDCPILNNKKIEER
jgi:hypothetical protein